ncbi:MAG: MucB/RseB C-terminal domain-containing protein [Armatimonadetes bacterium]|nr:MucB/RseB C-terminal domain-containing protein [Armatimonadota bacterium]
MNCSTDCLDMRIVKATIVYTIFSLILGLCQRAEAIDGATILKKMLISEGNVSFTAHQVTTLAKGPFLTSEQEVYRDGFKGMRTEYTYPNQLAGEIMIDDGKVLIRFIPRNKTAKTQPSRLNFLKLRTIEANRALERGQIQVELVRRDKIAGRNAYVLEVKPRAKRAGPTRKFWVDTEKWVKLKTEDIAPDGTVVSTSYYTRIDFTSVPPEKFRFKPPPGVRVERGPERMQIMSIEKAQRIVDFQIREPKYLPKGFKLLGATVVPFRHGKVVGLRYSDGVSSFSLFQAPRRMLDPRFPKQLQKDPLRAGRGVYAWKLGELNFTLIGSIPADEIRRIADSIK